MSHFTVLVIGNNPENQLAPYHEFETTGVNDQYVQDVDRTEEVQAQITKFGNLQEGLEYFGIEDNVVSDETDLDISKKHKYGYAIVIDGKLIKAVKRTNPNRKWDWYQLGGRWSGLERMRAEVAKKNIAITTFAVVKDGKWYARDEMGWCACVSNEKESEAWNKEFNALIDNLPDDTLLSVYGCHI